MSHLQWGKKQQARTRRILKRAVLRENRADDDASDRPEFLLPLRHGEALTLAGAIDVRVVRGRVNLWGAVLQPSRDFVPVGAPPLWAPLPQLRACPADECNGCKESSTEEDEIREYLAVRTWPIVVCFRLVRANRARDGYPDAAKDDEKSAADLLTEVLLTELGRPRLRMHRAWPSLAKRLDRGSETGADTSATLLVEGPRNVGKSACCRYFVNALLRADTPASASTATSPGGCGEVYFLETDLGQPELGPPCLVSLYRVRSPVLQVARSRDSPHECVARYFAGGVTPAVHPVLYVQCVRAAYDAYLRCTSTQRSRRPPLVVNTHGWLTGLGEDLVKSIHKITRPRLVVRIRARGDEVPDAPTPLSKLPPAKRRCLALKRCGPMMQDFDDARDSTEINELDEESGEVLMADVNSVAGSGQQSATKDHQAGEAMEEEMPEAAAGTKKRKKSDTNFWKLAAPSLRCLRFAGYLRPDLNPNDILLPSVGPTGFSSRDFFSPLVATRIRLQRLSFGSVEFPIIDDVDEVVAAFTGTVVALCRTAAPPLQEVAPTDASTAATSARPFSVICDAASLEHVPQCIGLAFLHSFDVNGGTALLFTPESASALEETAVVLRGDFAWTPHSVGGNMFKVASQDGLTELSTTSPLEPYCCMWAMSAIESGARARSTRSNVLRRGLAAKA